MKEVVVTVGSGGELEIPDEFRKELALQAPGTQLRVVLRDDRVIELRAAEAKPQEGQRDPDQAWFWSEEWQRREREADEDIGAGRVTVHEDAAAMMAHLDRDRNDE